jgi:UDP-N-acetylglucosamine 2-epimerase (non-hydrolysing)
MLKFKYLIYSIKIYMKLLICFGTRPEYIKVKSLIENMTNVKTCFTGQHVDLLKGIYVNYNIKINDNDCKNRLNSIICEIMKHSEIFDDIDHVLVQGDTTTSCAVALSAFNHQKKVIHLEGGLRSGDLKDPFPEELNRQIISRIADIHLCPTEYNKKNLLTEHVNGEIYVVGNTGLDNISKDGCAYTNKVLITLHRRDNHYNMDKWFEEIEKIAIKYDKLEFLIPLHPNPNVQKHKKIFTKVKIIEPMEHNELIEYVKKCRFVISDSGGLQEECSYLNKKIIVCRKTTERPESIGIHSFMCESPELLDKIVTNINENYEVDAICPYGDGNSWKYIINLL